MRLLVPNPCAGHQTARAQRAKLARYGMSMSRIRFRLLDTLRLRGPARPLEAARRPAIRRVGYIVTSIKGICSLTPNFRRSLRPTAAGRCRTGPFWLKFRDALHCSRSVVQPLAEKCPQLTSESGIARAARDSQRERSLSPFPGAQAVGSKHFDPNGARTVRGDDPLFVVSQRDMGKSIARRPNDYSVHIGSNDMDRRQRLECIFGLEGQKAFDKYFNGGSPCRFPVQYFYITTAAPQTLLSAPPVLPPDDLIHTEGAKEGSEMLCKPRARLRQ